MIMKTFRNITMAAVALLMGISFTACSDANEYKDANTTNPSFSNSHPESVVNTKWVRGSGIKFNSKGQEIQGFVESIEFISEAEAVVKMSQGVTEGTWLDESNTEANPTYKYTYSNTTGNIEIKKTVKDDKGKVSDVEVFKGVTTDNILTIAHYGDVPVQTYLVKQ